VPDFAKSAGTLLALAADKIVMSDTSELGPIDPQFPKRDGDGSARWLSVLNHFEAYNTQSARLRQHPNDLPAQIMLSKVDPATVVQFEAICRRARTLAEEHLTRWMFQNKTANYTKIAGDLMDNGRWPSHGQMISWQDAKQMELEVEYLSPESEEWRAYWSLYCLQRLAVKDHQKLFEADYAASRWSNPMSGFSANNLRLRKKERVGAQNLVQIGSLNTAQIPPILAFGCDTAPCDASSTYRQSAFASCICRGLWHSGSRRRGLPTKITIAWARDVATFSLFRL
jgi:Serine dehydrogenase proteinase